MSTSTHRCGWVAIMGPPNAGKSTLLNTLIEQKVTIVTPKPQTTRNQIVGILSEKDLQIVFMDTPGLSQGRGQLSKTMLQAVWQSLRQAEVIMPVLDAHNYILHPEYLDKDMEPIIEALRKIKYKGKVSLEFEKNGKNPHPGVCESIGYLRGVCDATK